MNAAFIVGLVALLIICGNCRREVTSSTLQGALQFLMTSTINKRQSISVGTCNQNQLEDIFANYPEDCAAELSALDLSSILGADPAAIIAAYRIICQARCGNPIVTFYDRCGLSQFTHIARGFCTRNDAGRLCYEQFRIIISDQTQVISNCSFQSSNCTIDCQDALATFGSNSRCCINIFNTTLFTNSTPVALQNNLWSGCGVDTPGFCNLERSTLSSTPQSSAEAPKFVKLLFLLTLVAMAMSLL